MLPSTIINARKHGIYTALNKKKETPCLSDTSLNKILQILHDDLLDIHNIYCTYPVYDVNINPAAVVIRRLVRLFIISFGKKRRNGLLKKKELRYFSCPWLQTQNLPDRYGFESCKLLLEGVMSKYLFVFELTSAKASLEATPLSLTDPNRREILNFITMVEAKAQQQKQHAIELLMAEMLNVSLFRRANSQAFTQTVHTIITAEISNNKALLQTRDGKFSFKRKVHNFRRMSTEQLKENIEKILFDNSGRALLIKEMSLLDRLADLHREDEEQYPRGKMVTFYYTRINNVFDWLTKEECEAEKLPARNAVTRPVPSEVDYMRESEQLRMRYAPPPPPQPDQPEAPLQPAQQV